MEKDSNPDATTIGNYTRYTKPYCITYEFITRGSDSSGLIFRTNIYDFLHNDNIWSKKRYYL